MAMGPAVRKLVLTVHLLASLGWVGAAAAYLVLGAAAATGQDPATVRAAWLAMELIGWSALVPLSVGALATGLVLSLGTAWGLFRHYWVVLSLALTLVCTAVPIAHMPTVSALAAAARGADPAGHGGDLFHAGGGLLVLLAITVLNVYKPRGLTPYGWRKQQEERARGAR